jgi:hypothetical protein
MEITFSIKGYKRLLESKSHKVKQEMDDEWNFGKYICTTRKMSELLSDIQQS